MKHFLIVYRWGHQPWALMAADQFKTAWFGTFFMEKCMNQPVWLMKYKSVETEIFSLMIQRGPSALSADGYNQPETDWLPLFPWKECINQPVWLMKYYSDWCWIIFSDCTGYAISYFRWWILNQPKLWLIGILCMHIYTYPISTAQKYCWAVDKKSELYSLYLFCQLIIGDRPCV